MESMARATGRPPPSIRPIPVPDNRLGGAAFETSLTRPWRGQVRVRLHRDVHRRGLADRSEVVEAAGDEEVEADEER